MNEGKKITEIGKENEEQKKESEKPTIQGIVTWSHIQVLTPHDSSFSDQTRSSTFLVVLS